ncbi:hypothetical protein Gpo141_00009815 [Globisporangium polare]
MAIRTWPPRVCAVLLNLVFALAIPPTAVCAQQQPLVISGVSLSFDALTATPTPAPVVSTLHLTPKPITAKPTHKPTTMKPTPAPIIGTPTPSPTPTSRRPTTAPIKASSPPTTKYPAATTSTPLSLLPPTMRPVATSTTAPLTAAMIYEGSGSSFSGATSVVSGNSSPPKTAPQPSPASAPAPTAAAAVPPAASHNCDPATSRLITKLYENNDVLEGDCAAVNNYYRFPFDTVPSRAQLINMSKSASCTVLMQALLQLVPSECDFKRIPVRSTAEAILQLAKDLKSKGESAVLPSEAAITKAIEARRQDLLRNDGSIAGSTASAATGSLSSSGSGWTISNVTSVSEDGQHILMDTDLLVVGTWSDSPESSTDGAPSPTRVSNDGKPRSPKALDTKVPSTTSASGSRQLTSMAVKVALGLTWISLQ